MQLRLTLPVVCAVMFATVGLAAADSNADEADVRFERGATLYKAQRYSEALAEFFASNRLAPNRNTIFNIARTYEAIGRYEEAYRYYAEYFSVETGPERKNAEAKLTELAPKVALVRIESDPPGATVYLDRKELGGRGETPLLIAYAPGEHQVILERDGYSPFAGKVVLERGKSVSLAAALHLIVGTLRVESDPPGDVFIDRAVGDTRAPSGQKTPMSVALPPGRHSVEIEAAGFTTTRSDVVIRANEETKVVVALEKKPPPSGSVAFAANVTGAPIFVDGEQRGFTPTVLSLTAGSHQLEVRAEGYETWSKSIEVEDEGRTFFQVELREREPEVTGATRSVQTISTAPASVSLITRDEIWAFGYEKLTDALRAVRGYYVSDDLSYESLGVRGFSRPGDYTNRFLVMRDGHAVNDNWIGSAGVGRDFAASLEGVSRIEIVRGPGSTFYGQSAFFGVVNVVSEETASAKPVRAGGSFDSQGGATGFAIGRAANRWGDLALHLAAYDSAGRAHRFAAFRDDVPPDGEIRGADAEQSQTALAKARVGDFTLAGSYSRRQKDSPTGSFDTVVDPATHDPTGRTLNRILDQRGFVELGWQKQLGPLAATARAAFDHQRYRGTWPYDDVDGAYILRDRGRGSWVTGELRGELRAMRQKITVGGQAIGHRVDQSVDEDSDGVSEFRDVTRKFVDVSGYLVDELPLGDRVTVTAGVRLDRVGPEKELALSPRAALVVRPYANAWTKLVAGRAFRAPSIYELYYYDNGVTQKLPDTALVPETVTTIELEHTQELARRSWITASAFAGRIEDLISLVTDDADALLVQRNSGDPLNAVGGELEVRLTSKSGAWVGGAVSYTRLDTDDDLALVNSASAVANLRSFWPVHGERLGLAAELIFNSRRDRRDGRETAAMYFGRIYASGRLAARGLSYRLGVENVLDQAWSVPVGEEYRQQSIPQAPRRFMLQLVYEP